VKFSLLICWHYNHKISYRERKCETKYNSVQFLNYLDADITLRANCTANTRNKTDNVRVNGSLGHFRENMIIRFYVILTVHLC